MAINFSSSNPAAPTGKENIAWQGDPAATPPAMSGNIPNIAGVNAQTGTSYTVQESDNGKLVTFSNAGAVAVTIPAAGTLSAKFHCAFTNLGAGTVTLTPTTSTIDGAANLALTTHQGATLFSDATNYFTMRGSGSSVTLPIAESDVTSLVSDLSTLTTAVAAKANLASPTFTGDPQAPTPSTGDNDTSVATTAFVQSAVSAIATGSLPLWLQYLPDAAPASPNAMDDEFDSNSIDVKWTAFNAAGTAVFTEGSGVLTCTATADTGVLRGYYQPLPVGNWSFVLKQGSNGIAGGTSNAYCGFALIESATSKIQLYSTGVFGSAIARHIENWSSANVFSSVAVSNGDFFPVGKFLKVTFDGTNYVYQFSGLGDGVNYGTDATLGKTSFFTTAADRIAVFTAGNKTPVIYNFNFFRRLS